MTNNLKLTPEMLLWKKAKVEECQMEFSCGGDSMNDYNFTFYDDKGKKIENKKTQELKDFFEDEVFKRVEFYVNSDGHYMGEAGSVTITLNEEDEEEPMFEYDKSSQSEWSETFTDTIEVELSEDELEVIQEKIGSMNGGEGNNNVNYKVDCILTNEEDEVIEKLLDKLDTSANEHEFNNEEAEGEASEWYTWSTNDDYEVNLKKKVIMIDVNRSFTIYKDEEF